MPCVRDLADNFKSVILHAPVKSNVIRLGLVIIGEAEINYPMANILQACNTASKYVLIINHWDEEFEETLFGMYVALGLWTSNIDIKCHSFRLIVKVMSITILFIPKQSPMGLDGGWGLGCFHAPHNPTHFS
jgi:hypothetical protein